MNLKILTKLGGFLKEVKIEMQKVNWPTRKETLKHTAVVIGISSVVAIFLGSLDFIFTILRNRFIL